MGVVLIWLAMKWKLGWQECLILTHSLALSSSSLIKLEVFYLQFLRGRKQIQDPCLLGFQQSRKEILRTFGIHSWIHWTRWCCLHQPRNRCEVSGWFNLTIPIRIKSSASTIAVNSFRGFVSGFTPPFFRAPPGCCKTNQSSVRKQQVNQEAMILNIFMMICKIFHVFFVFQSAYLELQRYRDLQGRHTIWNQQQQQLSKQRRGEQQPSFWCDGFCLDLWQKKRVCRCFLQRPWPCWSIFGFWRFQIFSRQISV